MKRNYFIAIYFIIFLAIGGIIILRNEMKLKSRETVVTYSFPSDEKVTNVVSDTRTTAIITTLSTSEKNTVNVTASTENIHLFIDINIATHEELCKLNGIGNNLADSIISYREQNGGFDNIEEIMNVHGIGENLFRAIESHIYVENPVYPSYEEENPEFSDDGGMDDEEVDENISVDFTETEAVLTLEDVAPIDLNTADTELLILLPHIDEDIAETIIDLRDKIHVFSHPYELLYIDELSRQQVAEIVEYVSVDNADESDN